MLKVIPNTISERLSAAMVLVMVVTTLSAVVFQDFETKTSVAEVDVEQTQDDPTPSQRPDVTVVEAVTSSVHLSLVFQYVLIDIVPLPGAGFRHPRSGDVPFDAGYKLSKILFRRIISPNAP